MCIKVSICFLLKPKIEKHIMKEIVPKLTPWFWYSFIFRHLLLQACCWEGKNKPYSSVSVWLTINPTHRNTVVNFDLAPISADTYRYNFQILGINVGLVSFLNQSLIKPSYQKSFPSLYELDTIQNVKTKMKMGPIKFKRARMRVSWSFRMSADNFEKLLIASPDLWDASLDTPVRLPLFM